MENTAGKSAGMDRPEIEQFIQPGTKVPALLKISDFDKVDFR